MLNGDRTCEENLRENYRKEEKKKRRRKIRLTLFNIYEAYLENFLSR